MINKQENQPLISIIIPTYNSETTIRKSLKSIIEQRFKNYELVIMDGVSKDNTIQIVKEHEGLITNLRCISEPDEGIYDAMNKAIEIALGKWLYFLGSNDYLINEHVLSNINDVIKDSNPDMIYGNVIFGDSNTVYRGEVHLKDLYFLNICHQGMFLKKEVILQLGKFDVQYKSFADWELNLKIFKNTLYKVKYVNQIIAYFDTTGTSANNYDESQKNRTLLINKYFSVKNRVLLFISKKIRVFSDFLIPKN